MPNEEDHSISELAALAGVTPRTVRYYVSIGLLPSPGQAGPGARYGAGHLARLRLIRQLQRDHLPLGEIGRRLGALDDAAVEQALARQVAAAPQGSALDYIRMLQAEQAATRSRGGPQPTTPSGALGQPQPHGSADPDETRRALDRTRWERVWLGEGVELHVRLPRARGDHKQIDRLIRLGRELLEGRDRP